MKVAVFMTLLLLNTGINSWHVVIYAFEGTDVRGFVSLAARIQEIVGLPVVLGERKLHVPARAFDFHRKQYRAEVIAQELVRVKKSHQLVLGIANVDMYVEDLNFVFGLALPSAGVAVVATPRLYPEFYGASSDQALFEERLLKECVHELGHLLGLSHCPDVKCVMHFSNSLKDTDVKTPFFCKSCREKLKSLRIF